MSAAPINYNPLFSYARFPELLPKLTQEAKRGLEADPKKFKPLNRLNQFFQFPECNFKYYIPQAIKILNGEIFQDRQGSLNRLIPLAQNYTENLEAVKAGIEESADILEPILCGLVKAHCAFQETFVTECKAAAPYEPFTILSDYPKTLWLYSKAFLEALPNISPELYARWKNDAENFGGEMLIIFPRLAILYLLDHPQAMVPELFAGNAEKIIALRLAYQSLVNKDALREALRGESEPTNEVQDLFNRIGEICDHRDPVMNGVARIVYEESAKFFALLAQMKVDEYPRNAELQSRIVFMALLKQSDCKNLPHDFKGGEVEEVTKAFYEHYHQLSEDDRTRFDHLFLDGADNADSIPVYNLLQDWKVALFHWMNQPQFPLHWLPRIAYQRQQWR